MAILNRLRDSVIPYRERPKGEDTRIERQELWCHDCSKYVQFDVDVALNGNHVMECPNCGHEHCRVVRDGVITDIRWGQRNGPTYSVATTNATVSTNSTFYSSTSSSMFTYQSWMNTTGST